MTAFARPSLPRPASRRRGLSLAPLLISLLLAACANPPPPAPVDPLLADGLFGAPSVTVDPAGALALDDAMRRFLRDRPGYRNPSLDVRQWLLDALGSRGQLQLEYDTARTRNAAEAFHARAGNCLSLVLMTSALAREMGLRVRYQTVEVEETGSRRGSLYLSFAHVNLTLGDRGGMYEGNLRGIDAMTIDFLPPEDLGRRRTREISEATVVSMYLNNRAVEALAKGQTDDAYAWVRAAIRHDPAYDAPYNTLAMVYRGRREPVLAERALRRVLERRPDDTAVLSNLVLVLGDQGRRSEADAVSLRLRALQPDPPYAFFQRGVSEMAAGRFQAARDLFQREIDRAPHEHEFHFWLARAELSLGNVDTALRHLAKAQEVSTTSNERQLYAAKLERLRAGAVH